MAGSVNQMGASAGLHHESSNSNVPGLMDKFYNVSESMEGLAGKFKTSASKQLEKDVADANKQ